MSDLTKFDSFFRLPSHLHNAAQAVNAMSGPYADIKTSSFDWVGFKDAVDTYAKKGRGNLTYDKINSTVIQQSDAAVSAMVDAIVKFLSVAFGASVDPLALAEKVKAAFTIPLSEEKVFLYRKQTGKNVQWEYRVVFAVPISGVQEYFYSLVTTIKIEAENTELKNFLYENNVKKFSAEIKAMQLVVKDSFKGDN
ncbi:delta-endotoxin CytB [Rhodocollybia butyracea]|uniref:Delta-endotoxin CytB n=1 Tax=Rhodocollybia butyracea TaxID=206335 RepID=A0A9P5UBK0_9AGAR|nr:delta-endotoxin CytB [Rhodocollybia butyracea]